MPSIALLLALAAPSADASDGMHSAVVALGDLDGDGRADVVAAERRPADKDGGRGAGGPGVWALSGADGSVLWSHSAGMGFGSALADAGDLDGDGIHDVAVARHHAGGNDAVLVLSGATGEVVRRVHAPLGVRDVGRSLAGGLDATGDGVPDLLVGARDQALIVDGATGAVVASVALVAEELRHPDGGTSTTREARIRPLAPDANGFLRVQPPLASTFLGCGVALLPDVDGDGRAEVAVGSYEPWPGASGRTYVLASADPDRNLILSCAGWCLQVLEDVDGDGSRELAATTDSLELCVFGLDDGKCLWRISYQEGYLTGEGTSLGAFPDLDGDGAPEVLLGANETGIDCDAGFAALYSGRTGAALRPMLAPTPLDERLAPLPWPEPCKSGLDVAGLPDLDGDGAPEVAVHVAKLGEVRVVSSQDGSVLWRVVLKDLRAPQASPGAEEDG